MPEDDCQVTESERPDGVNPEEAPVDCRALAEFSAWFMVVLAPILTWVNGPPVSTDQAVVRTIVFTLALTVGIVLTTIRLVRRWRGRSSRTCDGG